MKPKSPSHQQQGHLLYPDLLDLLDPKDLLLALAQRLPWERFEKEFTPLVFQDGQTGQAGTSDGWAAFTQTN